MKQFFFFVAALIALSSCNQTASTDKAPDASSPTSNQTGASSNTERNRQIALNGVMGFVTGDTSYLAHTDSNCVDYNDGTEPPVKGLDSIRSINTQMMGFWKAAFPDIKMNSISAMAQGDTVMVWEAYSGTSKGSFMGQKPTGKTFSVWQVDRFVFNGDGKIIEHRMTPNTYEVAKQIGVKL